MLFIFTGVMAAFLVEDYRDSREATQRSELIAAALYQDIADNHQVMNTFVGRIDQGLADYAAQVDNGLKPVPFVFEIRGSLTPPPGVWEMAGEVGIRELADPGLLFELSFFYSETQGVSENFVRYTEFTEQVFWPVALSDTTLFYEPETGLLRGDFAAHLQQLRDYRADLVRLVAWAGSLQEQLQATVPGIVTTAPSSVAENRYNESFRVR